MIAIENTLAASRKTANESDWANLIDLIKKLVSSCTGIDF
jgi:hypothetical protein